MKKTQLEQDLENLEWWEAESFRLRGDLAQIDRIRSDMAREHERAMRMVRDMAELIARLQVR